MGEAVYQVPLLIKVQGDSQAAEELRKCVTIVADMGTFVLPFTEKKEEFSASLQQIAINASNFGKGAFKFRNSKGNDIIWKCNDLNNMDSFAVDYITNYEVSKELTPITLLIKCD